MIKINLIFITLFFICLGYNNKGICHYNKKEYEKAIESFDLAIKINPNYNDAVTNKQIVLDDMNNSDKAEPLSFLKQSFLSEKNISNTLNKTVCALKFF